MTARYVLAVDLGTGGPKTALVSTRGELVGYEFVPVETRVTAGGGAFQDPEEWWSAITTSARKLLEAEPAVRDAVVAVSCTGQWGSTVPVDEAGKPVAGCTLWMDTRGSAYTAEVLGGPVRVRGYGPSKLWRWLRKTGGAPSPLGNDPLGHILCLRHEQPDAARRTATYLEPVDYLNLRFTGRAAASPASMTLSWLTDNRDVRNVRYDPELVRLSTIEPDRLPELLPAGAVVGPVLPAVARELGLPDGVAVVTGAPDLHSASVGSGAGGDFEPHLAISTTSWLSCHVPFKRTDIFRQVATIPAALPGRYLVADNHETAGACLQWLRDNVVLHDDGLGNGTRADNGYTAFDHVVEEAPPGSDGVIFTPWLSGERCPVDDRTLRAGFVNLSLRTTRAHMVRAVYEGVAYNARWMLEAVEKLVKRRLGPINFIGGGAASDVWCRIHADVLDRPVRRVAEPLLANVRGAALLAGLALGDLGPADIGHLVRIDATFEPDPSNRATYDSLYREFPRLYRKQRRMYARLNGN